jgi:hypothetical protein
MERIGGGVGAEGRDLVTVGLVVFGLYLVGIVLFAALAPGTFFEGNRALRAAEQPLHP